MLNLECMFCNSLTRDQKSQLATPSYKLKKEKKSEKTYKKDSSNKTSTLEDQDIVYVIGVVKSPEKVKATSRS